MCLNPLAEGGSGLVLTPEIKESDGRIVMLLT